MEFRVKPEPENPRLTREMRDLDQDGKEMQIRVVEERTMTFSNIQNVAIRQGPVQRLFGISDVEVRTAGGGSASPGKQHQQGMADNLHLGYFRGVENAAEIRDAILVHLKGLRSAGLGDPDEPAASDLAPDSGGGELLAAGRQVLAEARGLRQMVTGPPSPTPRP